MAFITMKINVDEWKIFKYIKGINMEETFQIFLQTSIITNYFIYNYANGNAFNDSLFIHKRVTKITFK